MTTSSAHNPVRGGITVLQRQDWFRGKLSGLIKGRAEQRPRGKKRERESASKNKEEKPRRRKPHTEQKPRPKFERKSQHRPLFSSQGLRKQGKTKRKKEYQTTKRVKQRRAESK
jgi:hypothetical protein